MGPIALEVRACASASGAERSSVKTHKLEVVRVWCVSNGRPYHDHFETQLGRIAARLDLELASPNGVKKQDRVVRVPKNRYVSTVRKEQEGKRRQAALKQNKRQGRRGKDGLAVGEDDACHDTQ